MVIKMFELKINTGDFLRLIEDIGENQNAIKNIINQVGGIEFVVNKIVNEYKNISPTDDSLKDIYTLGDLVFGTLGSDTYKEDWNNWFINLKPLPVGYLIMLLSSWCPKRHCDELDDSVLSYLLNHYYNVNDLTKDIYLEILGSFEREDLEPKRFEQFKLNEHYKNELLNFSDLKFLVENKYKISCETNILKDILCQVVIGNKLDTSEKLVLFCKLVKLFAPSNYFDRKYRDAFVLEIYESILVNGEEWEQYECCIWEEEFFDINFDRTLQEIKDQIEYSTQRESNHISEQLKINPNYRHD